LGRKERADKVTVEEAKFLNLGTKKLFSAEKHEFSWLLNGNGRTTITTCAARRDIQ
jgi:hypothetical protein